MTIPKYTHTGVALTTWAIATLIHIWLTLALYPKSAGPMSFVGRTIANAQEGLTEVAVKYRSDPFYRIYALESLPYRFGSYVPYTTDGMLRLYVYTRSALTSVELPSKRHEYKHGVKLPPGTYTVRLSHPVLEPVTWEIALDETQNQFFLDLEQLQ